MKKFTAQVSDGTVWLTAIGTETGISVRFGRTAHTGDQQSRMIAWFATGHDFRAWALGMETPLKQQLCEIVTKHLYGEDA